MNYDREIYREHRIVETDCRGHIGYAVVGPDGRSEGDYLARGLASINEAKAKIDKIIDRPRPVRR